MFLDIGVGILLTFLVSNIFGVAPDAQLFMLGIFFALLPDVDMLAGLLPKDSKIYKFIGGHRGLVHRPIVYVFVAPLVFLLFGSVIGTLFTLGVFYHLFHDTVVLGWGIKWFWPFSERSYRFFPDNNGKVTNKFLLTWMPEEEQEIKERYGSPNWIKDFYLTLNPVSMVEYSVFVIAISLMIRYFL